MSALRKNVASQNLAFAMVDINSGQPVAGLSPTVKWAKDGTQSASGGTTTDLGNGQYNYAPTQAETNCTAWGMIAYLTGYLGVEFTGFTTAQDPTDAVRAGMTALPNATAGAANGVPLSVDASGRVDVLKINGISQTARDIGASVLLSAGTGAGQLDFTSGVVKANLVQILATALTETAGQIAAAYKKFFDVAAPSTTLLTVSTYAGGAVASVTGAVGSVTARVTANTDQLNGQTVTAAAGVTFPTSVASPTNITAATGITVSTNSDKTGYALSAAAVQAIWDALTSALTTVGSVGKYVTQTLSVFAGGAVSSVSGAVGSVTARVTANADQFAGQTVTAAAGVTLPASVASPTNITAASGITVATNNDKTGYALSGAGVQAIWDALTSALTTVGSIGKALVQIVTDYTTARAAKIDNLDATISSRGTSTYAGGAVASVTGNVGGNVVGSVASVTAGVTVTTNNDKTGTSLSTAGIDAILSRAMTESYSTDGGTKTVAQALYEIVALLSDFNTVGTTLTVRKVDGSTTAMTITLDSATAPTSMTRTG